MAIDQLKRFVALRSSLEKERLALQKRLADLNAAFGSEEEKVDSAPAALPTQGAAPTRKITAIRQPKSVKNKMTLREAVTQVTKDKALTRREIIDAVQKAGFQFASKDPMNSLGAFLYTNKRTFKNEDGKWRAISTSAAATAPASPPPKKNGKPSRKMSSAGRARIAAAARARWAKVKEAKAAKSS
jgi:hypothetical protein